MLVHHFLEYSARDYPNKVALIFNGCKWSYGQLDRAANALASALLAHGFSRGDRAVVLMGNSPEAVITIFGILKCGGVFIPVHPTTQAARVKYIVNNCQAYAFFGESSHIELIQTIWPFCPSLKAAWLAELAEELPTAFGTIHLLQVALATAPHSQPQQPLIDVDLAALLYTSGSTSQPKGVMLTHLNMVAAATSVTQYLDNVPDDILLGVLSLSFSYGLYQILTAFKVGATIVLEQSFFSPHTVLQHVREEAVTGFPGVPTIFALMKKLDRGDFYFPSVRYVTTAGAALPTAFIPLLHRWFPAARIYSMYGLTECKRVTYLPPEELDHRSASVGKAMPNVETYIVDDHGRRLPPNEVGELVVRGSNIMLGYWGDPESTARALRPGQLPGEHILYTGDLFRMDEEGYLYFVARRDELIKSRGQRVSPREIEDVLYDLEDVVEAKVYGTPDEVLGQAIIAMVSLAAGSVLTERDIIRHCASHLEDFKVPRRVELRPTLSKTDSGKITSVRRETNSSPT